MHPVRFGCFVDCWDGMKAVALFNDFFIGMIGEYDSRQSFFSLSVCAEKGAALFFRVRCAGSSPRFG